MCALPQSAADFGRPAFVAVAFYLTARRNRVRADRAALMRQLSIAPADFNATSASMCALCPELACPPERKRRVKRAAPGGEQGGEAAEEDEGPQAIPGECSRSEGDEAAQPGPGMGKRQRVGGSRQRVRPAASGERSSSDGSAGGGSSQGAAALATGAEVSPAGPGQEAQSAPQRKRGTAAPAMCKPAAGNRAGRTSKSEPDFSAWQSRVLAAAAAGGSAAGES